ncbi:MAG: winged helix-turn-helix transcriptional regulator [Marmoricola sp.]|nr:winged helix-turn-helix transcriptional regulator [Marmoricola sp.]
MAGSVKLGAPPANGTPSPAHTLLFGPLGSTDVASAVVHRLRAAIGLGLLPDGERLPKEADLANQLGITTFALREALAELRKQGLIQTRAGKYGGSFVTHLAHGEDVEHAELVSLSSAELRDLGTGGG